MAAELVPGSYCAGGTHAQFRDPTEAWQVNGTYYSVVGTQVDCIGAASLYSSPDLTSWAYQGKLASQVGPQMPAFGPSNLFFCQTSGMECDETGTVA